MLLRSGKITNQQAILYKTKENNKKNNNHSHFSSR